MATLAEELQEEHQRILDTLEEEQKAGFISEEGQAKLRVAREESVLIAEYENILGRS